MKLMSLGIILITIGGSIADSDILWLPFVLVLTGALCMLFGQNFVDLEELEEAEEENGCQ